MKSFNYRETKMNEMRGRKDGYWGRRDLFIYFLTLHGDRGEENAAQDGYEIDERPDKGAASRWMQASGKQLEV